MVNPIFIKASILSNGVCMSKAMLENFGDHFLEKRRAYGNGDPLEFRNVRIPQEFYVDPKGLRLVTAVNVKNDAPWTLDCSGGSYFLKHIENHTTYEVDFPLRPRFYDQYMSNKRRVSQVVTLYGGGSLGIFAYGKCHLVEIGKPCQYCSISQNRGKGTDFVPTVSKQLIAEALRVALDDNCNLVTQIMLNGGNFSDMDKSFLHYVDLAKAIREVVSEKGSAVDIHMIVYPPKTISLIENLADLDIHIAMNTEIYDPKLFERFCPGKVATAGRKHILLALSEAAAVLGKKKVYSILVGGLEPLESLSEGLHYLSEHDVTPVINVLHTDPETPLENFPNPSIESVLEMGELLQDIYQQYDHKPFYENCGRNSLDTEAYKKLFK